MAERQVNTKIKTGKEGESSRDADAQKGHRELMRTKPHGEKPGPSVLRISCDTIVRTMSQYQGDALESSRGKL